MENEDNEPRKIIFTGTTTKYQMKKIIPTTKEKKKRVETNTWGLNDNELAFDTQLHILNKLLEKPEPIVRPTVELGVGTTVESEEKEKEKYSKLIISHIKTKLQSYKQQDILKKIYNESEFINLGQAILLLQETQMKCHYCSCETYLLYEIVREMKQWSLDRINNDVGHNANNLVMACLECNLKRRRTNKDSFMFTKNLKISREGL